MRLNPLASMRQSLGTRRELRRAERVLQEYATPQPAETIDLDQARSQLAQRLRAVTREHADDDVYAIIDSLVDSYVGDFRRVMYEQHSAHLNRLTLLAPPLQARLAQVKTLMNDELARLEFLDSVIANLTLHAADPETPITYTRVKEQPKERHK